MSDAMNTGDNENPDDARSAESREFHQKNPMNDPLKNHASDVYDINDPTWPMVVVQWRDAHQGGEGSWTHTSDYEPENCTPISVGWVWPKCKPGYLTLCSTVMNHAENPDVVSDVNHIPWENIIAVYSLAVHMPVNWNSELD